MIQDPTNTRVSIVSHIELCKKQADHHHKNALASKGWDSVLSLSNVILTGLTAFSMTLLSIFDPNDSVAITVVGASFALILGINNKVKDSYSFLALSYQHHSACDSYHELIYIFTHLLNECDSNLLECKDYDNAIARFIGVSQKSHIQTVKSCKIFCCFAST